jgi:hypothetical protein
LFNIHFFTRHSIAAYLGIGRINTLIFPIYTKKQAIGNCQVITRSLAVQ